MDIRTDEVAAGIYRVSVFLPQAQGGAGFMFNHFLIVGDEPMLFHCGLRKMFPLVSEAVSKVVPIQKLRWLGFGHFEADECGSMNEWLTASPHAELAHGAVGCRVSVADMADRPPRVLADGEVVDLGGKRVRYIDTPHVPHGWDAGVMFEETTGTLLCGDLFTRLGAASHRERYCWPGNGGGRFLFLDQPRPYDGAQHSEACRSETDHARSYARLLFSWGHGWGAGRVGRSF